MDDYEELRLERCARCQALFWICRPCYRGQGFCALSCAAAARTISKRRARSRHRQSLEGRLDHRDRERDRRRRAREQEVDRVADHTPRFLAAVTRVCSPPDPVPPIPGEIAIEGKEHDETRVLDDSSPSRRAEVRPATCHICFRSGVTVTRWARRSGSRHRANHARPRRVTCAGP